MNSWDLAEEGDLVLGGDFNIRLGEKGRSYDKGGSGGSGRRVSKDKAFGNGSQRMLDCRERDGQY